MRLEIPQFCVNAGNIKMYFLFFVIISSLCLESMSQNCPEIYKRFGQQHTFCKSANSSCKLSKKGVTAADIKQILVTHNNYRSRVATGKETEAGGLPQAADMMQMVWDKELAAVAQKHAEQCVFKHDKGDDRRVENFSVGQNMAIKWMTCKGDTKCIQDFVPDWDNRIKAFYDEVKFFNKNLVDSVHFVYKDRKKNYGHFTQVIWSRSWKIGCGFAQYEEGDDTKQLYVCNYGPGGNLKGAPVYKRGKPCTACPTNSCCCKTCKNPDYEGLCRMNSNSEAPLYPTKEKYVFYCDFRSKTGDCSASSTGPWKTVKALDGPYTEVVLKAGETATLDMKKTFTSTDAKSCFTIKYRTGAAVKGYKVDNRATIRLKEGASPINLPATSDLSFMPFRINLSGTKPLKVSLGFSVPTGAPAQYFNVQLLSFQNGKC